MRRAVLILLAVVLAWPIATASWYRCASDGAIRAECCCPAGARHRDRAPAQEASLRAAHCCTITQTASTVPAVRADRPAQIDIDPPIPVVAFAATVPPAPAAVASGVRPRAQGDPPDSLFARRCSLLL